MERSSAARRRQKEQVVEKTTEPFREKTTGHHGEVRGLGLIRRSTQFEGRFGRMFRTLPPAVFSVDALRDLARAMTAPFDDPTPEDQIDDEENVGTATDPGISAGYTYLGQFIDHDLTFDPVSSLQRQNDPDALIDYRTPRFDLDCLYGRGPDDQPYLYRDDGRTMLLGAPLTPNATDPNPRGLPRNTPGFGDAARALIGDPRNDENVIVSQLQSSMLRFHNRMAGVLGASATFEEIQRMVRWHYQWVVLHDFLPTVAGKEIVDAVLGHVQEGDTATAQPPQLKFYKPEKEGFMPLEFSVAAYRFGHSMIRPIYRMNQDMKDRLPIFSTDGNDLRGFRAFSPDLTIDWALFFPMTATTTNTGKSRVQPAYKIDTSLVNPLGGLPPSVAANPSSLPERNLLRGLRLELPSGQDVARAMGIEPIPDDKLKIGKATEEQTPNNRSIVDIAPEFEGNAPLWYYILAEAQQQFVDNTTPIRLGKVGGRIVVEVFVGLMLADSHSYLRQNPNFHPHPELAAEDGTFKMAHLLTQAMQA
jgi:Animal haem peroxidase